MIIIMTSLPDILQAETLGNSASMGNYNDDDDDPFDQHHGTMPTYAQKLEMEKFQIEKQNARTRELELQVQLLQMQAQAAAAAPSQPTNSSLAQPTDTNPLAFNSVVQRMAIYDPDSAIGKQITIFLRQVKLVSDPIQLTGSLDYTSWKESILSRARTANCPHILEEKETTAPTDGY